MKIKLKFPCRIEQIGEAAVEAEIIPIAVELITAEGIQALAPALSETEKERLAQDIEDWASAQALIRSIRVIR